jgi:hypothetical protein
MLQARRAHQGGLENLGDPGEQEEKGGVRKAGAKLPPSDQDIFASLPWPHPNLPSNNPKAKLVYEDTYRCARGARETSRTRGTLQKEKKRGESW